MGALIRIKSLNAFRKHRNYETEKKIYESSIRVFKDAEDFNDVIEDKIFRFALYEATSFRNCDKYEVLYLFSNQNYTLCNKIKNENAGPVPHLEIFESYNTEWLERTFVRSDMVEFILQKYQRQIEGLAHFLVLIEYAVGGRERFLQQRNLFDKIYIVICKILQEIRDGLVSEYCEKGILGQKINKNFAKIKKAVLEFTVVKRKHLTEEGQKILNYHPEFVLRHYFEKLPFNENFFSLIRKALIDKRR